MNDIIHHDGKGGFETESFRAKELLMIKTRGPHSDYLTQAVLKAALIPVNQEYKRVSFIVPTAKTCEVRYAVNKCLNKYMVMEVSDVFDAKTEVKKAVKTTHFLDTPAGRDWDNIVEWKKAQKESKTNK